MVSQTAEAKYSRKERKIYGDELCFRADVRNRTCAGICNTVPLVTFTREASVKQGGQIVELRVRLNKRTLKELGVIHKPSNDLH